MVPDLIFIIMAVYIITIAAFIFKSIKAERIHLVQKLYFIVAALLASWMLALTALSFTKTDNETMLYIWDSLMYIGCAVTPVFSVLIALALTNGWERLPKKYLTLFIVPLITNIVVWTNPLHHLFYKVFSVINTEVVFGPYIYVTTLYTTGCFVFSVIHMINFSIKNRSGLYLKQAILFSLGSIIPLVVSTLAILKAFSLSVAATPISLIGTIICHGIAIYKYHLFNLKPIALQRVLDWISDGYMVVSETGLVINFNQPFYEVFGKNYGISENIMLKQCVKDEDVENKTGIYNLLSGVESCKATRSNIAYEQSIFKNKDGDLQKSFYLVELTPLAVDGQLLGVVCIFKDVSLVKESMQRLQDSHERMMENERLASLGQMMGGLAHNLKTPIMSISGSTTAIENLIEESVRSLGDSEVTIEDYKEIYDEILDWLSKQRTACTYMSDIISAIKGQASSMSLSERSEFSLDEMLKRVSLLLRHELLSSGCRLEIKNNILKETRLQGDINNLVQVVNNMVSNSIDAQRPLGKGVITIEISKNERSLNLCVIDTGVGVPEDIKPRLFKQMITSKGTMGTGLGIYISNSVIKGKFGGTMWMEDNPGGGSIFGISIPLENVIFIERGQLNEKKQSN